MSAKQTLLANGSVEYEQISQSFLLFGDPATALRILLPRMPKNVKAIRQSGAKVRISWDTALDSNGGPVAGYHLYRASSPASPYSKISTALVTGTEFVDTFGKAGAGSGGGGGYYYGVTSEDSDGDQSAQSLGISPSSIVSADGSALRVNRYPQFYAGC